ncbi:hypothetical protein ACVIIV_003230 [Bradyrhizobium sp. USDA 4354]
MPREKSIWLRAFGGSSISVAELPLAASMILLPRRGFRMRGLGERHERASGATDIPAAGTGASRPCDAQCRNGPPTRSASVAAILTFFNFLVNPTWISPPRVEPKVTPASINPWSVPFAQCSWLYHDCLTDLVRLTSQSRHCRSECQVSRRQFPLQSHPKPIERHLGCADQPKARCRSKSLGVVLGKGGGDESGDDASSALASMGQDVAHEVDAGSLKKWPIDFARCSDRPYHGPRVKARATARSEAANAL